jgi:hypothetical protein
MRIIDSRRPSMRGMHGKWAQAGVPNKGWTCTGEQDLGSPQATCDMCETKTSAVCIQ